MTEAERIAAIEEQCNKSYADSLARGHRSLPARHSEYRSALRDIAFLLDIIKRLRADEQRLEWIMQRYEISLDASPRKLQRADIDAAMGKA